VPTSDSGSWRPPTRLARVAAVWGLWYTIYRAYYAAGGALGMVGVPLSDARWRAINGIGAAILLAVALAPLVLLPAWRRPGWRAVALAACWLVAVGGVMHATVDVPLRLLSLTGRLEITYPPFWATIDRRAADLQDLFLNEPWFLAEGLLWGAMAWSAGLRDSPRRAAWVGSAALAVLALTVLGVASGSGLIGRFVVG
jgi:hypothetical protein